MGKKKNRRWCSHSLHVVKGGESFKKVIKITKAIGPIGFSIGGFEDMEIRGTYVQGIHIFRIKYWTFCLRTLEASTSKSHWKTSIYYMTHGKDEINFDSRFKTIKPNLFYIESQEVEIVEIHCPWALAHVEKGSRSKKKWIENSQKSTSLQLSSLLDREDIKSR